MSQIERGLENSEQFSKNTVDTQYLALLQKILDEGIESSDRTGTGTKKLFGESLKFDLSQGFPLLTTKKVWFKGVKEELLWMIRGERNIRSLVLKGVNIWNEWPFQKFLEEKGASWQYPKYSPEWQAAMAVFIKKIKEDEEFAGKWGDLGPVYGFQWRHWKTRNGGEIDQLANAINKIINKPDDRRIIITSWNPEDVESAALPPCHLYYQFQVARGKLNCAMVQRSVDSFLGLPFNIASYGLLTEIVAKIASLEPGTLTLNLMDTHLYLNHLNQAKEQLSREPRPLPRLILPEAIKSVDYINGDEIQVAGYDPHEGIEAPISV